MPNQYTKKIRCPDGDHEAIMYTYGHEHAGMWECMTCDVEDMCEHPETHVESLTSDHMGFSGHYQTEDDAYVCDACECVADGNPAEDAHDAMVDSQLMEALGK